MANSGKMKVLSLWALAIFITLVSVVYQKMTGPTYPVRGKLEINGELIKYKLLRSHETTSDAVIEIPVSDTTLTAIYKWKRYKSHDDWTIDTLKVAADKFSFTIPKQPAAGKVMYHISLIDQEGKIYQLSEQPVIIRFKGAVPIYILIPHILFMFSAMLCGVRTGLEAIARGERAYRYAFWTTILLFVGGIILGPIVQKFAFDAYWTGWPFGHDLTDNKTALAFILWVIALWKDKKGKNSRVWFIVASIVQLLVYLVPHSVLGSEIDYTSMNK